ncbi:CBS domain-containing protein [Nocardia caishijiensis]|uniref:CBS domain protein n=1 Tax=Nocardia caishijiensis TaxID=184756 RepID=A0ABQ6YMP1_9NOCA|nr:CBS domain-containing protein [Nocardia caishijiensis]KAF0846761.1 CBS domain protein [Nocardia caishijiensis]
MRIAEILRNKGTAVATVPPETTVRALVTVLAERNIGAVVVSPDGVTIEGIVSERDVVRCLAVHDAELLDRPVAEIMTARVRTCRPDDDVSSLRDVMTEHRIRHMPVVSEDRLIGIVSIGDVVKSEITELATEREQLVDYLQGGY